MVLKVDNQHSSTVIATCSLTNWIVGFDWIVLDDCWHPTRNDNGTLVPFAQFFPDGMKPVIDYVHSLGMKVGGDRCANAQPSNFL